MVNHCVRILVHVSSTHGPIFFESKAQPLIELAIFYNDRIAANNHVFTPFFH